MRYSPDGSLTVTLVTGNTFTGAYNSDGAFNIIEAIGGFGSLHQCGALRVTFITALNDPPLNGESFIGSVAPDGSLYETELGTQGVYHPCGAIRINIT